MRAALVAGASLEHYLADGLEGIQSRLARLDDGEHRLVVWQAHPGGREVVRGPDVMLCIVPGKALHRGLVILLQGKERPEREIR